MQTARMNERALFQTQVDVVPHAGAGALTVWCQDLSETGMFVQTTQAFATGDLLSLRFEVDGLSVHIRAAEVVWVRKFEPINVDGRLPGLGLRFVSLDPPARGALRRIVQRHKASGEVVQASLSRVPKPPPVPSSSATTTVTTGLPEPAFTLPPVSRSIIEAAGGATRDLEDTQDLLPPAALTRTPLSHTPPGGVTFSMLPFRALDVSLPPDEPNLSAEARVFDGVPDTPRAVTMTPTRAPGPRAVTMGPMPAKALSSSLSSGPSLASAPPRQAVTQKLFSLPPTDRAERLAERLEPSLLPEVPARLATMSIIQSLPPASAEVQALMGGAVGAVVDDDALPAPADADPFTGWTFAKVEAAAATRSAVAVEAVAMPAEIENPSILEERPEGPTLIPSLLPVGTETSDGYSLGPTVAATSEPPRWRAEEQTVVVRQPLRDGPSMDLRDERRVARPAPARRPSRMGPAVAVLALGCAAGAAVALLPPGTFGPRASSTVTPTAIVASATAPGEAAETTPTPLPVAVAEQELRPATTTVKAAEVVATAAPSAAIVVGEAPTAIGAVQAELAEAEPAKVEPAKAEPAKAEPAKAEPIKAEPVKTVEEPVLASSTRATPARVGGRHEVTLPEAGRLKKVFALDTPARVVVDLEGGRLPGATVTVGHDGVEAVRFGQPSPEVRRVVVVLDGARKPDAVDARLEGDRLIVTWQH